MASIHEEEVLGKAYDSRLMKRLLTYLRPYKWHVTLAVAAIIIKAIGDVLGPFLVLVAIDKYLGGHPNKDAVALSAFDSWMRSQFDALLVPEPFAGISQVAIIYLGLLVLGFLLEFAQTYLMQLTGQHTMFDLRGQIFRHLQRMHIGFFDKNPVGRLVTRVTTDVDALNELFTAGVVAIVEDIFVLVLIVTIMLLVDWKLALITLAVLPLIFFATQVFRVRVRDSYRRIRVAIARINAYLQEHITGIVVLQLFNREKKAYQKFEGINATHMEAYKDSIMAHAVYYPVVEILSSFAIAAVIWFGGHQVLSGTVTVGVLVAFIQYAQRFFRPIQDLSEKYNILQAAMASSERVFKLLDTPAEVTSPEQPRQPDGPGRIEFDHVWFAYRTVPDDNDTGGNGTPASQPETAARSASASVKNPMEEIGRAHEGRPGEPDWVLCDVSFTIEPGETVAIVGHTGAGKTTILSLLLRFYDVQRGAIRIDGVDIREMDLVALRRRFGMVLQDPFLFTGTVEQNIRLGTEIDGKAVERAAEEVNVADFIRTLPNQFREPVRERGSTLSTGQKQLISFARALAHNPRILVLDEATSSVDTETEFRVRDALARMISSEGRTSIVVAHRLSTVQRADKIIVMHKGRVREIGTHQQLLTHRGIYWKLYQLQYKDQEIPGTMPPAGGDGSSRMPVGADD